MNRIIRRFSAFILIALMVLGAVSARAQKNYFIYLQADPQQPFYVQLNKKTYSSSPMGYLVLSQLRDTVYSIRLGFPGKADAQEYDLTVQGKDQGFLVKNFGDKGWGLFNLQTLAVQYSGQNSKQKEAALALQRQQEAEAKQKAEAEAQELVAKEAKRLEDSLNAAKALAEKQRLADVDAAAALTKEKEQKLADSVAAMEKQKQEAALAEQKKPDADKQPADAAMKKLSEQRTDSGIVVVYKDGADTVKALLPQDSAKAAVKTENADTLKLVEKKVKEEKAETETVKTEPITEVQQKAKAEPVFLDMEISNKDTLKIVPPSKTPVPKPGKKKTGLSSSAPGVSIVTVDAPSKTVKTDTVSSSATARTEVKAQAGEKDFYYLRKKMVSQESADEMIAVAKKAFKEKQYSCAQVRNLAVLLLSDADKYAFLDMAYPLVADPANFASLADMLKDEYYLNRFKAMLK